MHNADPQRVFAVIYLDVTSSNKHRSAAAFNLQDFLDSHDRKVTLLALNMTSWSHKLVPYRLYH